MMLSDVYEFFSGERMNIELLFVPLGDGSFVMNMRGRTWKGTRNGDRMLLVGGRTPDECLVLLAQARLGEQWIPLDWSKRLPRVGVLHPVEAVGPPNQNVRSEAVVNAEARLRATMHDSTRSSQNVAYDQPQKRQEQIDVTEQGEFFSS